MSNTNTTMKDGEINDAMNEMFFNSDDEVIKKTDTPTTTPVEAY